MVKHKPIIYNALLLTIVNLVLRFVSTSFQVYLSGKIGAAGIGLLQLVLSVGGLALTVGMGGIRTATMYLCAEVVGQKRSEDMGWVLSGCIRYSLIVSLSTGALLYCLAPEIAEKWIGNTNTVNPIRLLACTLPINCLCGVMIGHFTGTNRIGVLAIIEVAEQILTMIVTVFLLNTQTSHEPVKACQAVILGSGFGACFTLTLLLLLKKNETHRMGKHISVRKKLWDTAVPLAIADNVKAGISTTENLMVPKRLALFANNSNPLATFGMVCGMVFPVLMFPAAILFALAELLIPELARCNAAGSTQRIRYITQRSIQISLLYSVLCGGILFLKSDYLCVKLYNTEEAGQYLRWFSVLAPMLYCDAIIDAMAKGLGQQKKCVRYNIITSAMDVVLLFILLPAYGMKGYYISFLITHLVNFILSTRLLVKLVGKITKWQVTSYTIISGITATLLSTTIPEIIQIPVFILIYMTLLLLLGAMNRDDIRWIKGIFHQRSYNST